MTKTITFKTERGANIDLSNDGRTTKVRINGGDLLSATVEDRAGGLVILTDSLDHVRKVVIAITIPVPAAHVDAVNAYILAPTTMTPADLTLDFVGRLNAESNRPNSKF